MKNSERRKPRTGTAAFQESPLRGQFSSAAVARAAFEKARQQEATQWLNLGQHGTAPFFFGVETQALGELKRQLSEFAAVCRSLEDVIFWTQAGTSMSEPMATILSGLRGKIVPLRYAASTMTTMQPLREIEASSRSRVRRKASRTGWQHLSARFGDLGRWELNGKVFGREFHANWWSYVVAAATDVGLSALSGPEAAALAVACQVEPPAIGLAEQQLIGRWNKTLQRHSRLREQMDIPPT